MTASATDERVVVIGAGIVGLCCAYFLQQRGFKVDLDWIKTEISNYLRAQDIGMVCMDNVGLLLKNVVESRVSDCLIRDDREDSTSMPLLVVGGHGNQIIDNLINGRPQDSE